MKLRKDSEDLKVEDGVFDDATLRAIFKLANKGVIKRMDGCVSTGKEADVFYALGNGELAIKVYRIATSSFRYMQEYLMGDPRFKNIRKNRKSIVLTWARKEFGNLKRAYNAGVSAPKPIDMERNVIVMEFIGANGVQAPRLIDVRLENPAQIYKEIKENIKILQDKAGLIHSDLSPYNILYDGDPILIDMGQAVTLDHLNAKDFLRRDLDHIENYFKQKYDL